jgi:(4S)-4-hydroxy-5-phosphonooxypentane-2,3-dione isomerase
MFVVCVTIQVVPEHRDAFLAATRLNAEATRREPGNIRFDVLRAVDDPSRFFLYEAYLDDKAFRDHQRQPHYLTWKDRVAAWMAQPRVGLQYESILPDPWA